MPCIVEFFGIAIYMYYNDHPVYVARQDRANRHFHAEYAGDEARYEIENLRLATGLLPRRAHNLVMEWADMHRTELIEDWQLARQMEPLRKIQPLD